MHKRRKIFFWSALSWTGVILYLCLIKSSSIPEFDIANLDKLAHVFFHFVFVTLWYLYLEIYLKKTEKKKLLVILFLMSFCFGTTIEILQGLFTITRNGDVIDVLANTTGAVFGLLLILIKDKTKHFQKNK